MTSFRSTATSILSASILCALCVFAALPSPARAEDWPQWRGPQQDGVSTETNVPTKWSATDNIKWKVTIPGSGYGSPIVVGDRIFLNTALEREHKRLLLCLDRNTGQTLWHTEVLTAPLEQKNKLNNYASSTPACDGQRVFVTFQDGKQVLIAAYDLDGKPVWRHKTGGEMWASPMVADGKVYIGTRKGDFWILAAGRELKVLGQGDLGAPISGTATAANGTIYVATMKEIWAIGK